LRIGRCLLYTLVLLLLAGPAVSQSGHVGLFPAEQFRRSTGECADCVAPEQALWYFHLEQILTPRPDVPKDPAHPPLVWLGSSQMRAGARLSSDGTTLIQADGQSVPLQLVQKHPFNKSWFNETSKEFFQRRSLRVRGVQNGAAFVARTIWPEDYDRVFDQGALPLLEAGKSVALKDELQRLIEGPARAEDQLAVRLLWERTSGRREWYSKPVLGLLLNGAQGDDDDAHGGHFAFVTGVMGPRGEWADWVVNSFYPLDVVSEKGILAAQVPLDNYLMDLNSGQQWYRPSYLAVAILKDERTARRLQASARTAYERFYRHELKYDHAYANCAGISIDIAREAGWNIPFWGPTFGVANPIAAFIGLGKAIKDGVKKGRQTWSYLTEEQVRVFPRATFESGLKDILDLAAGRQRDRQGTMTEYEQALQDDVLAVLFVRIPQIPSSRAFGRDPVRGAMEYNSRVPTDESLWQKSPVRERPFPPTRDSLPPPSEPPAPV
jgi:hypothetical protein